MMKLDPRKKWFIARCEGAEPLLIEAKDLAQAERLVNVVEWPKGGKVVIKTLKEDCNG